MPIFYSEHIADSLALSPEESRHCHKVLRKQVNDELEITNGQGSLYRYRIKSISQKACEVVLVDELIAHKPLPYTIHIAIAPTKNLDRMEWFVEKATELGVHEISLVLTQNAERRIAKTDRLIKKAIAAMKQSGNLYLPKINELISYNDFFKVPRVMSTKKFIAYVPTNQTALLYSCAQKQENYTVMIGPEGDFTEKEVLMAEENGYQPVSLGGHVLRTETAGLAAIQHLSLLNQV